MLTEEIDRVVETVVDAVCGTTDCGATVEKTASSDSDLTVTASVTEGAEDCGIAEDCGVETESADETRAGVDSPLGTDGADVTDTSPAVSMGSG